MNSPVPAVVESVRRAALKHERNDLEAALTQRTTAALHSSDFSVLVFGEFKKGKSSIINGLLNYYCCPVDSDEATAVPTVVQFGDTPRAEIVGLNGESTMIAMSDAGDVISTGRYQQDSSDIASNGGAVRVSIPRGLLELGIALIDMPGSGGLSSPSVSAAMHMVSEPNAVILVTDASQELTASELTIIRQAHQSRCAVIVAVTKCDIYPAWRRIVELNRGHSATIDPTIPVIAVATPLRMTALASSPIDHDLDSESGHPLLTSILIDDIFDKRHARAERTQLQHAASTLGELESMLVTERRAATEGIETVRANYEREREAIAALRATSSRWNTALGDSMNELSATVDHRLGLITRSMASVIEDRIASVDPADDPDGFLSEVRNALGAELVACYTELNDGIQHVASAVAETFEAEAGEFLPHVALPEGVSLMETYASLEVAERPGLAGLLATGLRGSYGGVAVLGMFSSLLVGSVGAIVLAPATIAAGLMFGRRAVRDESKRRLDQRRNEARTQTRSYVDSVTFELRRVCRQVVRDAQRDIRDQSLRRLEELQANHQRAVERAGDLLRNAEQDQAERLATIDSDLTELAHIHAALQQVQRTLADS